MAPQRSDRLKAPPSVGGFYLVPAVLWSFGATFEFKPRKVLRELQSASDALWWPVWGRKHNDVEHFDFEHQHYHLDPRFFSKLHWRRFEQSFRFTPLGAAQGMPLNHSHLPDGPPKPSLRKMRCSLAHSEWEHHDKLAVIGLNAQFQGQVARAGKRGLVCPHRQFPLGSIVARDGVVTCPLHGLRIDVSTGRCLGPLKTETETAA